jgi:hypothetical protein
LAAGRGEAKPFVQGIVEEAEGEILRRGSAAPAELEPAGVVLEILEGRALPAVLHEHFRPILAP